MSYIVLDEAQTSVVSQAKGDVEVRDRNGRHLGYIAHGFTDAEISIARARADSEAPRLSTADVLRRLTPLRRSRGRSDR